MSRNPKLDKLAVDDFIPVKRKTFQVSGTFDIECADWTVFVCGVVYNGNRRFVFHDGDAMLDHLMNAGGTYWCHCGGTYDLLDVLERCRTMGIRCQIDRAQGRVTRVVIGKTVLRDSYAVWPVPLDVICGAIGEPVPELPWACICGHDCGGYCQIRASARAGDPELEDYCTADCTTLYQGLVFLDEFCQEVGIDLRGTMGHSAWLTARHTLGIPPSSLPWDLWRSIRRADIGGRSTIIWPHARGPGSHYDICNAYPAQLAKTPVPVGMCSAVGKDRAHRCYLIDRPGIYTATVVVPESFLPPLPRRTNESLSFPTGEFTGTWPLTELNFAESRGIQIKAIHDAVVWEDAQPVFAELVDRWYQIRRAVGRKSPLGQWIGRFAKALTGKFSERPERQRVLFHPKEIKICPGTGSCRGQCSGRCGAYTQLDILGNIWAVPYSKLSESAYPHWSAYLRAGTRMQWLEAADASGLDLCMGNTDSVWTTSRVTPTPLGDDLGQWEYQHAWTKLDARSVTVYAFRDEHGAMQIRGIPGLTEEDWRAGAGSIDRGIVTFGRAVGGTRGLFTPRHRRWTLPPDDPERIWYGDRRIGPSGATRAASIDEIRRRDQAHARMLERKAARKIRTPPAEARAGSSGPRTRNPKRKRA